MREEKQLTLITDIINFFPCPLYDSTLSINLSDDKHIFIWEHKWIIAWAKWPKNTILEEKKVKKNQISLNSKQL